MARRRASTKEPATPPVEVVLAAPERADPIAGPRALAFSTRMAAPAEYIRALLVIAVVAFDRYTKE